MRGNAPLLALAFALVATPACSKKSKPDAEPVKAAPEPAKSVVDPPGAPAANADGDPVVELLDAGAEPRAPMRLQAKVGLEQHVDLAMLMSMRMTVAGSALPSTPTPRVHMPMAVKVTDVRADGTRSVEFSVEHVHVDPDPSVPSSVMTSLTSTMSSIEGMHGSVVVTDRGFNRGFTLDLPPGAPALVKQMTDGMKQSMSQMVSPFPAEAVGVGAKWRVTTHVHVNGMDLTQTANFTVTDRKDPLVSLDVSVKQAALPQTVDSPALPPGATMHLDALDSVATGKQKLDLNAVMPLSADVSLTTDSSMTIDDGKSKQPLDMHLEMSIALAPE